jgi:hypothetical protein
VDNLSVGMGILARKSLSNPSRKASQISLLNDSFTENYHHTDDRNWSWSYLRVSKNTIFYNGMHTKHGFQKHELILDEQFIIINLTYSCIPGPS